MATRRSTPKTDETVDAPAPEPAAKTEPTEPVPTVAVHHPDHGTHNLPIEAARALLAQKAGWSTDNPLPTDVETLQKRVLELEEQVLTLQAQLDQQGTDPKES